MLHFFGLAYYDLFERLFLLDLLWHDGFQYAAAVKARLQIELLGLDTSLLVALDELLYQVLGKRDFVSTALSKFYLKDLLTVSSKLIDLVGTGRGLAPLVLLGPPLVDYECVLGPVDR